MNILVLASDNYYLEYTKQVFYSAHRYGNWQGEYGLFVHNVPHEKLQWFKDRGIHIFEPEPLIEEDVNGWPPIIFHKCYLVHPMMKPWKKVVYLDTDVTILRDINKITKYKGFTARKENGNLNIRGQFLHDEDLDENGLKIMNRLNKTYNLNRVALNVGVMVFETKYNSMYFFERAKQLIIEYKNVMRLPEQALFNLLFYNRWNKLPSVYNDYTYFFYTKDIEKVPHLQRKKKQSKILHFIGLSKPWDSDNYFYDLWTSNLASANDFPNCNQIGEKPSALVDVLRRADRKLRKVPMYLAHGTWLAGQQLQRYWPSAYQWYKKITG